MKRISSRIFTIALLLTSSIGTTIGLAPTPFAQHLAEKAIAQPMHRGGMMGGGMMGGGMMGMMRSGEQSDRAFIEMMIPHHDGAVKMADIILKRTKRPELRELATAIKRDQTREVGSMKGWYKEWYKANFPSSFASSKRGMMGMGGGGMGRMMAAQVQQLENATDSDRVFLEEMIPHHKMALMMTAHIVDSDRSELRTLAKNIMQTQSAEIEKMRQWYKTWYR
jgi:uncharacterized protein (DUF305 family)